VSRSDFWYASPQGHKLHRLRSDDAVRSRCGVSLYVDFPLFGDETYLTPLIGARRFCTRCAQVDLVVARGAA